jgi:Tfp pilus assembly protein PilZ
MPNVPEARDWIPNANRQRLPVECPVTLEMTPGGQRQLGAAANLSPTGFFVASPTPFPIGTMLRVSLSLPFAAGPRQLVATAQVRWVNNPVAQRAAELPAGMGIEFVNLDHRAHADLRAFLDELLATPAGRR